MESQGEILEWRKDQPSHVESKLNILLATKCVREFLGLLFSQLNGYGQVGLLSEIIHIQGLNQQSGFQQIAAIVRKGINIRAIAPTRNTFLYYESDHPDWARDVKQHLNIQENMLLKVDPQ